jgi:hypothetical protein
VRPWLRTGSDRTVGSNDWSAAPSRSRPPVQGAGGGQNWYADAAESSGC